MHISMYNYKFTSENYFSLCKIKFIITSRNLITIMYIYIYFFFITWKSSSHRVNPNSWFSLKEF